VQENPQSSRLDRLRPGRRFRSTFLVLIALGFLAVATLQPLQTSRHAIIAIGVATKVLSALLAVIVARHVQDQEH
jgi:hypothetical protein